MTFKTHCRIAKGRIDPAPMVDVMFLLLVFIILSSPFVLQTGSKAVELPTDNHPTGASFQNLVVMITRDNLMFFKEQPITVDGLRLAFEKAARESRNSELVIKADRQVTYQTVMKITSMAFESGISVVNYASRPETPAAATPK
jgi:biopolymer transport protein ExbD